jgi:hypothetical protein
MTRPVRIEFAGALYHVTSRGDRREAIYEDDADRGGFGVGLSYFDNDRLMGSGSPISQPPARACKMAHARLTTKGVPYPFTTQPPHNHGPERQRAHPLRSLDPGHGLPATTDPYPPSTRASSPSTQSADATRSPVQPSASLPVMVRWAEILSRFVPVTQAGAHTPALRGSECSISEPCRAQPAGLCY